MLRIVTGKISTILRSFMRPIEHASTTASQKNATHDLSETDEEFDQRYIEYFERCEIDGWEIRKGMNDLLGMDLIPDTKIIIAGLHACRRVNDIALAIRWIEGCKHSCGSETAKIYPYIMSEILPTMKELDIPTLEELYYDQPEFALKSVYEM